MIMNNETHTKLKLHANTIRKNIIRMLEKAGSGHTAGSLGMADIFSYLYLHELSHKPTEPNWNERDRLVLSNGHICPVLYVAMAETGYFPISELMTLRMFGSRLQGHPHREYLAGIETSSGPLGQGLSQSIGMALAERIDKGSDSNKYFYCLLGDGEINEGNIWESALHAGKEKLSHIIVFLDRNNIQIDGFTDDVMPLEPLDKKWESFGFYVQTIDGHDFNAIDIAVHNAKNQHEQPSIIIAKTIPGKGVPDFENIPAWHGKSPNKNEAEYALSELEKLEKELLC